MKRSIKITIGSIFGIIMIAGVVLAANSDYLQGRILRMRRAAPTSTEVTKVLPSYNQKRCYDSDSGKNYEEKGTTYGTMTSDTSKTRFTDYCDGDTLVEYYCSRNRVRKVEKECASCGKGACEYCTQNNFKTALILVYEDQSQLTGDVLNLAEEIVDSLPEAFEHATSDLATMGSELVYIKDGPELYLYNEGEEIPIFSRHKVAQHFYTTHEDVYDFLLVTRTFDGNKKSSSGGAVTDIIKGIGQDEASIAYTDYGSQGRLKGTAGLADFTDENLGYFGEIPTNNVVHEIGHTWCCWVGDSLGTGGGLEIREGGHWISGLESGAGDTLMFAKHWELNSDGTYHYVPEENYGAEMRKFHPFVLYFMGLLPESEWGEKYPVYDTTKIEGDEDWWNSYAAPKVKEVSVMNIIETEGERYCK
jgi:hypothetical protein